MNELDDWLSRKIWWMIKGKEIPPQYTEQDRLDIIKRYWHKAMEGG